MEDKGLYHLMNGMNRPTLMPDEADIMTHEQRAYIKAGALAEGIPEVDFMQKLIEVHYREDHLMQCSNCGNNLGDISLDDLPEPATSEDRFYDFEWTSENTGDLDDV